MNCYLFSIAAILLSFEAFVYLSCKWSTHCMYGPKDWHHLHFVTVDIHPQLQKSLDTI